MWTLQQPWKENPCIHACLILTQVHSQPVHQHVCCSGSPGVAYSWRTVLSLSLTLMCPLSGSLSFFVPLVFPAGIVVPGFRVVHHGRPRGRHAPAHGWRVSAYPRQLEKVVQSKDTLRRIQNTQSAISDTICNFCLFLSFAQYLTMVWS